MNDALVVLHDDGHFLAVAKPTGLPTTSPDGRGCLAAWVREARPRAEKHHPTSRLDAEVTGVVTFALTRRAIEHALAMRASGRYARRYLGLTCSAPAEASGRVHAPIALDSKDPRKRRVAQVEGSVDAASRYEVLARSVHGALLALYPETGRTHQLRVHAAHLGAPLAGDVHYGGPRKLVLPDGRVVTFRRVMLHCERVALPDFEGRALVFEAPLPDDFARCASGLGVALGARDQVSGNR